jgi:hypothetical protein
MAGLPRHCFGGRNQRNLRLKKSIKIADGQEQKSIFSKIFYSFSHIELRELGIENQKLFSTQTRKFVPLKGDVAPSP